VAVRYALGVPLCLLLVTNIYNNPVYWVTANKKNVCFYKII
jgi:hypothetical protein